MTESALHGGEAAGATGGARAGRPAIKPRKMGLEFGPDIPRWWFMDSPVATQLANSINLLFPLGERFFIRSVRYYEATIKDPALAEEVRGFYAQEVRHAMEHERFFKALEAQGYSIEAFLKVYNAICYGFIEKVTPPKLRLSVTVALEHFTAMFAEQALTRGFLDGAAHPAVRDLLMWHACEEIEHKCVAFDLLKEVDPSYSLRMAGLAASSALLGAFWLAGAVMLLAQDKAPPGLIARHLSAARSQKRLPHRTMAKAFLDYLRPDFHPADNDNFHMARAYFERLAAGARGAAAS